MAHIFHMSLFCVGCGGECWLNLVYLLESFSLQREWLYELKVLKLLFFSVLLLISSHLIFLKTLKTRQNRYYSPHFMNEEIYFTQRHVVHITDW